MTRPRSGLNWWVRCVVHNCVIHPILPIAEVLDRLGAKRVARAIFAMHDGSVPEGGG